MYVGEVDECGQPHGYGVRVCLSGTMYFGYHKKGLSDGYGAFYFNDLLENGEQLGYYEGMFKDDYPISYGKTTFTNGEQFEGIQIDEK